MQYRVKIITDDFGEPQEPVWHISWVDAGSPQTFCGGEVFGFGEGNATYEERTVKRGGITCEKCLKLIRAAKSVRL